MRKTYSTHTKSYSHTSSIQPSHLLVLESSAAACCAAKSICSRTDSLCVIVWKRTQGKNEHSDATKDRSHLTVPISHLTVLPLGQGFLPALSPAAVTPVVPFALVVPFTLLDGPVPGPRPTSEDVDACTALAASGAADVGGSTISPVLMRMYMFCSPMTASLNLALSPSCARFRFPLSSLSPSWKRRLPSKGEMGRRYDEREELWETGANGHR